MIEKHLNGLHLPDLSIRNFRGIEELTISRLGRVTLLGGRNGVGKTTVLEAVRVHAARGRPGVLSELLERHEELAPALDEDLDPVASPHYAALFNGRSLTRGRPIRIGPKSSEDELRIEVSKPSDWTRAQREVLARLSRAGKVQAIKVVFREEERFLPWVTVVGDRDVNRLRHGYGEGFQHALVDDGEWPVIECESLGPGLPSNRKLATFWDSVALTDREDISLKALRLTSDAIERVAAVGEDEGRYSRIGLRIVVRLRDHAAPVPLRSLGEGITRLFAVGLALATSSDGFLLVDEAENGIHYSVQQEFWRMVLLAAHQHNVQVLATTHSSDCVTGFARAAAELDEVEGTYVRLDRQGDQVRAVEYTERELLTVAKQGIEAR